MNDLTRVPAGTRSRHTNRTGVGCKRVVVGEPVVDPGRVRRVEPREERQLLQVVGETIAATNWREIGAA